MEEKKLTDEELKQAFFILRHGSSEGLSEYVKAVLAIEGEYNRQKAEIERLNGCILTYAETLGNEQQKNAELQKQVDELKAEKETLYIEMSGGQIVKMKLGKWVEMSKIIEQKSVKETAKEILQELYDQIDENTPKWIGEQIKIIAKRKGVEVE